jgi:hypothetical protein
VTYSLQIEVERKAGPLPLPELSGPDQSYFNHYNLVDVINLCNVGCLRPTDVTNKAFMNKKTSVFGSEPLKPTSLFL